METRTLTGGTIFSTLIGFAVPVLFALFLQALYGGVDLLVVGQFATTSDVSGVATGSTLLNTVTMVITDFTMGVTIIVGEKIGEKKPDDAAFCNCRRHCQVSTSAMFAEFVNVFCNNKKSTANMIHIKS